MMTKAIVHISDLHLGINTRKHEHQREVIASILSSVADQCASISGNIVAVITGDVFDRKDNYGPREIMLLNKLIDGLAVYAKFIIIVPGNHDCELGGYSNAGPIAARFSDNNDEPIEFDDIPDLITPLVPGLSAIARGRHSELHFWRDSGMYDVAGIRFMYISILDRDMPGRLNKLMVGMDTPSAPLAPLAPSVPPIPHVIIHHGQKLSFVKPMKQYEFAAILLGDKHTCTCIDAGTGLLPIRIAYAGSIMQMRVSEKPPKGYIMWHRSSSEPVFIPTFVEIVDANKLARTQAPVVTDDTAVDTVDTGDTSDTVDTVDAPCVRHWPFVITAIEIEGMFGLSRKIRLRMNFEPNKITWINGDNSCMKTSIIDAMMFALYGSSARGANKQYLMTAGTKSRTQIEFTVLAGEHEGKYRLSRDDRIKQCLGVQLVKTASVGAGANVNTSTTNMTAGNTVKTYSVLKDIVGSASGFGLYGLFGSVGVNIANEVLKYDLTCQTCFDMFMRVPLRTTMIGHRLRLLRDVTANAFPATYKSRGAYLLDLITSQCQSIHNACSNGMIEQGPAMLVLDGVLDALDTNAIVDVIEVIKRYGVTAVITSVREDLLIVAQKRFGSDYVRNENHI